MRARARARSRRTALAYRNGSVSGYDYTMRGDLLGHSWDLQGGTPGVPEIAFEMAYNGAGQLVSRRVSDSILHWSPPSIGTDAYAVNGKNQYTQIGSASPVHDGNGNVATDHRGRTYEYSAENALRKAREAGTGTVIGDYIPYADGTIRYRSGGGVASARFYYDGDQEILETAGTSPIASAQVRRRYIRLPGSTDERSAITVGSHPDLSPHLMIDYTLSGGCASGSSAAPGNYGPCERWAHQDRLGSVVATTNSSGAVVERYKYGAYGELGTQSASGFPFRYTGQKLDPATGLYRYKARWYDADVGRFLQTDPIGYRDQMNLHAYVANDPVNKTDPTGMCSKEYCPDQFDPSDPVQQTNSYVSSTSNTDGSVTDTRTYTTTNGVSGEGSSVQGGSVTRLPQDSANGAPAQVTETMQGKLLTLSEDVGKTVEVTSGVRTPEQNQAVGGVANSPHFVNQAADIRIQGNTAAQTADAAYASGQFNRVNQYTDGRGVHVDLRSTGNQGRFTDWRHQPDP